MKKIIFIGMMIILSLQLYSCKDSFSPLVEVHFIDVGQGDSILIRCITSGRDGLIDAGDRFASSHDALINYLSDAGVDTLIFVMTTHPHADHIGGIPAIVEHFTVLNFYDNGESHNTLTYQRYLDSIRDAGAVIEVLSEGDIIQFCQFSLLIVSPPVSPEDRIDFTVNDLSIVAKLDIYHTGFLFTGDIMKTAENRLINERFSDINCDVLKVAHHGSNSSTSTEFLNAATPKHAVISAGTGNRHGHPRPETLDRLITSGVQIFRTDLSGSIIFTTDGFEVRSQ